MANLPHQPARVPHRFLLHLTEENVGDTLNEDDNINETDPTISARFRIPTEKGKDFKVQLLKQSRTAALSAISRKRTEIRHMMSDQNNIDLVRNELTTFDTLCQHYQEEHINLYHALETAEEKDQSSLEFSLKESESFEFRKQVVQWLTVCEQRINDQLDHLHEQRSRASHSSRSSRSSRRSHASKSSRLSAAEERAKVAELLAERSMLSKKLEIQQAEEQLNLDLKIAKAHARERVFTELEREEHDHSAKRDDTCGEFTSEMKHAIPPVLATSPSCVPREKAKPGTSHLHPTWPEFYYRAVPNEIKTESKEEANSSQRSDEELLKEIFKV